MCGNLCGKNYCLRSLTSALSVNRRAIRYLKSTINYLNDSILIFRTLNLLSSQGITANRKHLEQSGYFTFLRNHSRSLYNQSVQSRVEIYGNAFQPNGIEQRGICHSELGKSLAGNCTGNKRFHFMR